MVGDDGCEELKKLERLEERAERQEEALRETREEILEVVEDLEADRHRPIPITVNHRPVVVVGHEQTGLQIKEAAIAQGVRIQLDFVLSEELHDGRSRIIGDDQRIEVKSGACFEAIPNDDHS